MSSNQRRRAVKAFTLIELLVVVSVIALLLSILLPALSMAKEAARRAQCAGNVRKFGIACQLYAQETGVFPFTIGPTDSTREATPDRPSLVRICKSITSGT